MPKIRSNTKCRTNAVLKAVEACAVRFSNHAAPTQAALPPSGHKTARTSSSNPPAKPAPRNALLRVDHCVELKSVQGRSTVALLRTA